MPEIERTREYSTAGKDLCNFVESGPWEDAREFIRSILEKVASVYHAGTIFENYVDPDELEADAEYLRDPTSGGWLDGDAVDDATVAAISKHLIAIIGKQDGYSVILDPFGKKEAQKGSVVDDIVVIYRDIKDGFHGAKPGILFRAIVNNWADAFWTRWGKRAINLMGALHVWKDELDRKES